MKHAQKQELLNFLLDVDERLGGERPAKKIALYIFGGAAAVIAYGSRRGTRDIDEYVEDRAIEAKLLGWAGRGSELEKKHGFYFHKANTELMLIETPEWKERSAEILKGGLKHLRIMALSKEDLLLSKLSRYNDRDREDIGFLIEKHGIEPRKLIAYYRSARLYYAGNPETLDTTFNIVLKEHFGLKPRSFAQ
ncbi:MAG: hypothetical protein COT18_06360 [Elusimicrobia bacterium CG08_land_8_20_14_0_20_59_10]|nr:MAG: hypothetical protein COT18_06360 [Elusimicrobia bacterium CG08_land_8_20_14_0_20_59_10]